jgi:hypothetical protein
MGDYPTDPQYPTDPRHDRYPADPEGSPDPRWRVALAVAVVVIALVLAVWYLTRGTGTQQAAPPPSPSATPTVTVTRTPEPTPSTTAPGPCQVDALDPSVGTDGGAAGTVYFALLFRNTGTAACTVGGRPTLSGVTAGGTVEPLSIPDQIDGSQAALFPVGPAGQVAPNAQAGVIISKTSDPTNCPAGGATYATLRVDLGAGQVVSMPYPQELAPAVCLRGESEIGPVTAP